jgi:thiol-disulfide isomerase/thioredoxin
MKKAVLIIPAVAVAAVAGALAQRWLASEQAPEPALEAPLVADSPLVAGVMGLAPGTTVVPDALPDFEMPEPDGTVRTLGDWKGRPLMVNYWATWCGPCREEIPLLNKLRAEGHTPKLEILGIAVDHEEAVMEYVGETPIDYPILIGDEQAYNQLTALGMQLALPITVFTDREHRILMVKTGELHREEAELILGQLADVEAGTTSMEDARRQIDAGLKQLAVAKATAGGARG